MAKEVDYILVGGGLAGACLAFQFLERRKTFAWFDTPSENRASAIAAGLFNPITNKVMNKSWDAHKFFNSLHDFYSRAEVRLGKKFFRPGPLYRPFVSAEEQNSWMVRSVAPEMKEFVRDIFAESRFGHHVDDPHGGIQVNRCGYLEVLTFIQSVKDAVKATQLYREERFVHNDIQKDEPLCYRDLITGKIVFCEGTAVQSNPIFNWVPVKSLKGETLEIKIGDRLEQLYNRGVYLVPLDNGHYKVGATYQHNVLPGTTAEGKKELIEKLDALLKLPYEVAAQDWGFRPTIIDRKPALGAHPEHSNLILFNALGTKGVSLAPHFSGVLADWLEGKIQLEKDVNISRFYALYSKF